MNEFVHNKESWHIKWNYNLPLFLFLIVFLFFSFFFLNLLRMVLFNQIREIIFIIVFFNLILE